MQVERLKLNYFRNYEALDLRPNPGLNVIVGENAHICAGASVGASPSDVDPDAWGVAVVASNVTIGKNAKLGAKEMAGEDLPDQEV